MLDVRFHVLHVCMLNDRLRTFSFQVPLPCTLWNLHDNFFGDYPLGDINWSSQCAYFSWRMMFRHTELMQMKVWMHPSPEEQVELNLAFVHVNDRAPNANGVYSAISTTEDGANALMSTYVYRNSLKPGYKNVLPKLYIDQFVAIDGPPFQRYFSPTANMASRRTTYPCSPWLEMVPATEKIKLVPSVAKNAVQAGACRVPRSVGGLARAVWSGLFARPKGMSKIMPRMYRDPAWKARMVSMEKEAKAEGCVMAGSKRGEGGCVCGRWGCLRDLSLSLSLSLSL